MCTVMRNLNTDLNSGTRLFVHRVSARSVRVVESPVYEGPGFACNDESDCAPHPASSSSGRSSVIDLP